jgi:hypothetical protein
MINSDGYSLRLVSASCKRLASADIDSEPYDMIQGSLS